MANSTVCQSKWKPIVEPRRAKPKTYRQAWNTTFRLENKYCWKETRKINKWPAAHGKENDAVVGISRSLIRARRHSDGCIITRDASRFKLLKKLEDKDWREYLLRSCKRTQQETNSTSEDGVSEGNDQRHDDAREETVQQDEYQHYDYRKR